jgi:hypothetical protein
MTLEQFVEALLNDLRPKMNEVLAVHTIPEGLSRSDLAEAILALQVKGAFDFAYAHGITILEFSFMLRSIAEKLENEFAEQMQQASKDMEPENIEALMQDAADAEEKFDRETNEALSKVSENG